MIRSIDPASWPGCDAPNRPPFAEYSFRVAAYSFKVAVISFFDSKAAAGGLQASTPKTLLHIGDERLVVLSGPGEQAATEQRLDIGVLQIARDYFHHDPPTALEIERAIDVIEDEIMRLGPRAGAGTTLWSTSDTLQAWSAVSGATMAIETVEQWFQRLAAAALGQPGAMQGLPAGREAAATLLILREFMHHLGYPAITVADAARAQD